MRERLRKMGVLLTIRADDSLVDEAICADEALGSYSPRGVPKRIVSLP